MQWVDKFVRAVGNGNLKHYSKVISSQQTLVIISCSIKFSIDFIFSSEK